MTCEKCELYSASREKLKCIVSRTYDKGIMLVTDFMKFDTADGLCMTDKLLGMTKSLLNIVEMEKHCHHKRHKNSPVKSLQKVV